MMQGCCGTLASTMIFNAMHSHQQASHYAFMGILLIHYEYTFKHHLEMES